MVRSINQSSLFTYGYPIVVAPFVEKSTHFPLGVGWYDMGPQLLQDTIVQGIVLYFQTLYFVMLIQLPISTLVTHCLGYCDYHKPWSKESLQLCSSSSKLFWLFWVLCISIWILQSVSFYRRAAGIFIRMALNRLVTKEDTETLLWVSGSL